MLTHSFGFSNRKFHQIFIHSRAMDYGTYCTPTPRIYSHAGYSQSSSVISAMIPASFSWLVTPAVMRSRWFHWSSKVSPLSISADGLHTRFKILNWELLNWKKKKKKEWKGKDEYCTTTHIQSSSKGRAIGVNLKVKCSPGKASQKFQILQLFFFFFF